MSHVTRISGKPENILISSINPIQVKLTDFGWCALLPNNGLPLTGKAGTPQYMSMELSCGGPHGPPCDIYSLGVTLSVLLQGKLLNSYHQSMLSPLPNIRPTAAKLIAEFGGPTNRQQTATN